MILDLSPWIFINILVFTFENILKINVKDVTTNFNARMIAITSSYDPVKFVFY
jgi:hypothetical protein